MPRILVLLSVFIPFLATLSVCRKAAVAAEYEGINPMLETIPPVSLGFLPFYHTYGLHYVVIRPVAQVIPTIVLPRWNVDAVLDLIPKYALPLLEAASCEWVILTSL
ncbi:hypothetical protein NUW54_g14502 [Trametes sanguinea]|uniref:Uncharacterized protein n=1 Tax=Trametes sanguinea TaxID=158606 RepID=A0ACC1MBU2_9APHY|nr:hypothetical protein NUW54_g14502 [Trametes sanguinea]